MLTVPHASFYQIARNGYLWAIRLMVDVMLWIFCSSISACDYSDLSIAAKFLVFSIIVFLISSLPLFLPSGFPSSISHHWIEHVLATLSICSLPTHRWSWAMCPSSCQISSFPAEVWYVYKERRISFSLAVRPPATARTFHRAYLCFFPLQ